MNTKITFPIACVAYLHHASASAAWQGEMISTSTSLSSLLPDDLVAAAGNAFLQGSCSAA